MDKLDETEDISYEVETSFSTMKNKRLLDTNKEEVDYLTIILRSCHIGVHLAYGRHRISRQ